MATADVVIIEYAELVGEPTAELADKISKVSQQDIKWSMC
jgi:hypothetical protein